MKIVIFGASGFLGKALATHYLEKGNDVYLISRNDPKIERARFYPWDGKTLGNWASSLEEADIVINMAGKSVNCRYTKQNKELIYSSRLDTTTIIGMAIEKCKHPPKFWINSSSATIYRHATDRPQDEPTGEIGADFSCDVCKRWEQTFFKATTPSTIKYALRIALVLDNHGGVLPVLNKLVKVGLGGSQGSGTQKVSWIHIEDFLRAIAFITNQKLPEGIYNICAPNPTDNKTMMRHLRQKYNALIGLPTKNWMLKVGSLLLQTETELVLKSRWVVPTKLLQAGFVFQRKMIDEV